MVILFFNGVVIVLQYFFRSLCAELTEGERYGFLNKRLSIISYCIDVTLMLESEKKERRDVMIALRKMSGQEFVLNSDLIESLESTPDTLITLTSGKKIMVRNNLEDVVKKAVKYKQLTHQSLQVVTRTTSETSPVVPQ